MWIDEGPKMKSIRNSKIKWNNGKVKGKQDQRGSSRGPKRARNEKEKEGIDVYLCGIDVDRSCIDVASMSHRCGIDVVSMWHRLGIDVASTLNRCGIDVASMWIDGGPNMTRKRKRNIKWTKGEVKRKRDQRGPKSSQVGPK